MKEIKKINVVIVYLQQQARFVPRCDLYVINVTILKPKSQLKKRTLD